MYQNKTRSGLMISGLEAKGIIEKIKFAQN
jgi:uncharacterized membrane protein